MKLRSHSIVNFGGDNLKFDMGMHLFFQRQDLLSKIVIISQAFKLANVTSSRKGDYELG